MPRHDLRTLGLVLVALAGCSSPSPASVDVEARALDLEACIRGDAVCRKTGAVSASEALIAGDHAVAMSALSGPASISLPLERAEGGRSLRWLALGMRAINENAGRTLTVTIDGGRAVTVEPNYGWTRVEVDMNGLEPAPGARVTITAVSGRFDLVYTSGRWNE